MIILTHKEKYLFNSISTVVNELNLGTIVRVAGGWVRDKLLGIESCDIDFAIDSMTGKEFFNYLRNNVNGIIKINCAGVVKINSDKSKHLETARMRVTSEELNLNIECDITNLRTEIYSSDSRVPVVNIGTPQEDAFRRDLTINSLFYNIVENKIEDFTGYGLDDLKNKIARTPMDAEKTLLDDPLRILRILRFTSRFNLALDNGVIQILSENHYLLNQLKTKVSKERIGSELKQILYHANWISSIELINKFNLFSCMAEIPDCAFNNAAKEAIKTKFYKSHEYCEFIENQIFKHMTFLNLSKINKNEEYIKFILKFAAISLPFTNLQINNNNKLINLVKYLAKYSLKYSNCEVDNIVICLEYIDLFTEFVNSSPKGNNIKIKFANIINLIQRNDSHNSYLWEFGFVLAYVREYCNKLDNEHAQIKLKYKNAYDYIYDNNLDALYSMKLLMDGDDIIKRWNVKDMVIGNIKTNIYFWQILNPIKTYDDLIDEINLNLENFSKLNISILI